MKRTRQFEDVNKEIKQYDQIEEMYEESNKEEHIELIMSLWNDKDEALEKLSSYKALFYGMLIFMALITLLNLLGV